MRATAAFEVADDERCWDAQNAVRVEVRAGLVHSPIHFDDEASLDADEIGDEATDDHLAAERAAHAAAFERRPQALLSERWVVTQLVSFGFEHAHHRYRVLHR
jgi:hypothetical protein